MRIAAVLVFVALAGTACAGRSPQPSVAPANQETLDYAEFVMTSCFRDKAGALDDGISDASTVGAAVARACRQESVSYMRVHSQGMIPGVRHGFIQGWERIWNEIGTTAVLGNRRRELQGGSSSTAK